ncbi:olfactory receptor 6X1-like [Eublepharis macularius]|uniref:Olfactory receptor 6X1-like n=1 Tax=Eublepharis macularius TaxID=481883 RepID=A0AA97K8J8_EUBMA|nr:olfactory receptor 6X1-like [Eublepharis macularius]
MEESNVTFITEFVLLGFPELHGIRIGFFAVVLLMYLISVSGNCLIITVVFMEPKLHMPMYFFLSNFSLAELWSTTAVVPKMLTNLALDQNTICLKCCMAQSYVAFSMGAIQFFNLTVMSFDRYAAICKPFSYNAKMTNEICLYLSLITWFSGFTLNFFQAIVVWTYPYCGHNVMDHFFCDVGPLLKLVCTDTSLMELIGVLYGAVVMWGSFLFTLVSYACIITTIVQIPSVSGRSKAFSTCSSHLTVVGILYGATFFMYLRPSTQGDTQINKVMYLMIIVFLPMISPFIFTIRNKEFKASANKVLSIWGHIPPFAFMEMMKKQKQMKKWPRCPPKL